MGRPRGVDVGTVTLPLSDGDSITVKRQLTADESHEISNVLKGYSESGKRMDVDMRRITFIAPAVYIVGWSLLNLDGTPRPWLSNWTRDEKMAALGQLDEDTYNEIRAAVTAHREARDKGSEKNAMPIESGT